MSAAHAVVSAEEWNSKRIELLAREKEFTRLRDELSAAIRDLPWQRVEKQYAFEGSIGALTLADLFDGKSQLILYHFMFGDDWDEGCQSCSFVTDSIEPCIPHLAARDVAVALVSRAPLQKLNEFRQRMGWQLNWVCSAGSDFNRDYQVSSGEADSNGEIYYNYKKTSQYPAGELPGLSVFNRDDDGRIFHSYSTYGRGLESFIGTYRLLDIVPRGRDEDALDWPMQWIRHHDRYQSE